MATQGIEEVTENAIRAVARSEWNTGALARAFLTPRQAEGNFGHSGPHSVRPFIHFGRELGRYGIEEFLPSDGLRAELEAVLRDGFGIDLTELPDGALDRLWARTAAAHEAWLSANEENER